MSRANIEAIEAIAFDTMERALNFKKQYNIGISDAIRVVIHAQILFELESITDKLKYLEGDPSLGYLKDIVDKVESLRQSIRLNL